MVTGGWNSKGYREFREFAPDVDSTIKYFDTQTDTDGRSGITASFTVDVGDPNEDGRLTGQEINAPGFRFIDQVTAHATVGADVDLRADVSIAGSAAIPHVMTIFHYSQTFADVTITAASGFVLTGPQKPTISFEDVTTYFRKLGITRQKTPERMILVEGDFPRTPSGKIKKHELRAALRAESQAAATS